MEGLNEFLEVFWDDKFWLPPNITWHDIKPGVNGINHADYRDLFWPLPLSILLILLRFVIERDILKPLGRYLKIKDTQVSQPDPNPLLEENYQKYKKLSHKKIHELSKKLELSERDIERWVRRKTQSQKSTKLHKFSECCWKGLCYTICFSYGIYALWNEPYLWNLELCAINYPHHAVSDKVWTYYLMNLTFYWSLLITHMFDTRRKDFWEMFLHHLVAVPLISFGWVCNIHRMGSLIMVIHDAADIFLEFAKSLKYAKFSKACDIIFLIFVIVWIITRLMIYPRLLFVTFFRTLLPAYPVYYLLNSLLSIVLFLHIYWTYLIYKVLYDVITKGSVQKDERSSSEETDEDDKYLEENDKLKS